MMKAMMGNSCSKGCLFYVVALTIVIAVTALGFGGLKGRFANADVQGAPVTGQGAAPGGQAAHPQSQPGDVLAGGGVPGGFPTFPAPSPTSLPATTPQTAPRVFTPVPSQGGIISGEASLPFYVVQPGDSLWDIAQRFGVSVETLRSLNHLTGNTIYPGQIIYLPQGTQP